MSRKANRGVSLIEIMIGLVLGLILIASVSSLVLAGRQTSRAERNLLQMQATGRIATELLAREIRKAGYRSNREQPATGFADRAETTDDRMLESLGYACQAHMNSLVDHAVICLQAHKQCVAGDVDHRSLARRGVNVCWPRVLRRCV